MFSFYKHHTRLLMQNKVFYLENLDGNNENYKEIFFVFDSTVDISCEANQIKPIYKVRSIQDFYSILENDKYLLSCNKKYIFESYSERDLSIMLQGYQLLSFKIFHMNSKERLNTKMQKFNKEICNQTEKHIAENISEFARINCYGKFIRGTLVNLGYNLFQCESVDYSDDLALAFEIFQTAILIHDDIIDHASLRRNQTTIPFSYIDKWVSKGVERKESMQDIANSMAICAGDIGMYFANQKVVEAYRNSKSLGILLHYFNKVIIKTIQGEIIDVILPFEEQYYNSNEEDLTHSITEIYRLKTAWYTVIGPLCLGAILAGIEEENIKELENFSENLGIAFQIKDDILGIYACEDNLGKDIGSDITEFKQTLLYAFVRKHENYFNQLLQYYGKRNLTNDDLKVIQNLFLESGALKYAEQEMDKYFERAIENLNAIKFIAEDKKSKLFGLIWYLKLREY